VVNVRDFKVSFGRSTMFFAFMLLVLFSRFVFANFSAGFYPLACESDGVADMLLELIVTANFERAFARL